MKIQTLMERIFTGRKVKFSEEELQSGSYRGNKVIVITDTETNHKYLLYRSITNFIRFQRWIGKTARADIAPIKSKKYQVESGWLAPVRISTVVEVTKINRDRKSKEMDWDYNYDYNPEEPPDMRQGHAGTE